MAAARAAMGAWLKNESTLLRNAASLVGSTAVTSLLGIGYWWLAARLFAPAAVGLGSATISAMTLIGAASMMGLGTLLIGEIPRRPANLGSILLTCLVAAGLVSGAAGTAFALLAPTLSSNIAEIGQSPLGVLLFAFGVCLTALSGVLDDALVGFFRSDIQFWRHVVFACVKLALLPAVALVVGWNSGMGVFFTWVLGTLISLLVLLRPSPMLDRRAGPQQIDLPILRGISRRAIAHHSLNLVIDLPGFAMPIIVTVLVSAAANAAFYMAWMIAAFVGLVAGAFTTVLYAVGSGDPAELVRRCRTSLVLSLALSAVGIGAIWVGAWPLLSFFGAAYAGVSLQYVRFLALGALPIVIKKHYIAVQRTKGRVGRAALLLSAAAALEIAAACTGVLLGGVEGLSLAWLTVNALEALMMLRPIWLVIAPGAPAVSQPD